MTRLSRRRPYIPNVDVEWKPKHVGGSWWALVDRRIAGEVVPYGSPGRQYWYGFAGREKVPGEYATDDEAKLAVEHAVAIRAIRRPTRQYP